MFSADMGELAYSVKLAKMPKLASQRTYLSNFRQKVSSSTTCHHPVKKQTTTLHITQGTGYGPPVWGDNAQHAAVHTA